MVPRLYLAISNRLRIGGNDVFVDIGDKSWGVRVCQEYFGGIDPSKTLHIGDQFLSAGANDFKVGRTFPLYLLSGSRMISSGASGIDYCLDC